MDLILRPAEEIRAMVRGSAEYAGIYDKTLEPYRVWRDRFDEFESPERVSGWWHNYVCPDCAGHLIHNRDQPLLHVCSQCGKIAPVTADVLEAWTYSTRCEIADSLVSASLAYYVDGDARAREYIIHVVDWYAEHYAEFPEHGLFPSRGRVMAQSLDEAVWGIKLLHAIANIGFDTTSARGRSWYRRLFQPVARLVMSLQWSIHNIPLWHASFSASAALVFGDEQMYTTSMRYDLGACAQVLKGFTPDGIWYENSNSYHYYSLEAAGNLCVFLCQAKRSEPAIFERVLQAILAPVNIAYRDGVVSAMNDGGTGTNVFRSIGGMRRLARPLAGVAGVERLYALIGEHAGAPTRDTLLYDVPKADAGVSKFDESILLSHNRVAVLRSPATEVYIKFGNLTRSHAHPDALSIAFGGFSIDPGTTGYGSQLHREWFTKTLSHCTFLVGARSMSPLACGEATLNAAGTELVATVADTYPGVTATRKLTLDGAVLNDVMTVETTGVDDEVIDWVFHAAGELTLDGDFEAATLSPGGAGHGYEHLSDVRRFSGGLKPLWTLNGRTLKLEMDTGGAEVYIAASPDNPATRKRTTVLVRRRARRGQFSARYTFG